MKNQLPEAFIKWLADYMVSNRYRSATRLHRGLVLRLALWRDGHEANALPGYDNPPPDGPNGYPVGWSVQSLREIARECEADIKLAIRRGFRAAASC